MEDGRDLEGCSSDVTDLNPTPVQEPRVVKTPQVEWLYIINSSHCH